MEIRPLRADEIECRASQVKPDSVSLLLYKDARCDMRILDELFTPFGWQRHHEVINGKEFCTVSVKDENGEWISKQDCGTESNTEKEKGQSSDAFKRACFNWGIGRELYTAPFIKIPSSKVSIAEKNGKNYLKSKLFVSDIKYNGNKEISELTIKDEYTGCVVFEWSINSNSKPKKSEKPTPVKVASEQIICPDCGKPIKGGKLNGENLTAEDIMNRYGCCMRCNALKQQSA